MSIDEYLGRLGRFVDDPYGRQIRNQFQSIDGKSELAMLQSPTAEEYAQLQRAVAIMTATEKAAALTLTDRQVEQIAQDAKVDKAVLAIFFNGYVLQFKTMNNK